MSDLLQAESPDSDAYNESEDGNGNGAVGELVDVNVSRTMSCLSNHDLN